MKIAFSILTEFLKYQQPYTLLKLIEAAKAKNHEIIGVFCFGTGVLNISNKGHLGKNTRNLPAALEEVAKSGIKIYACQTWADNYSIFPDSIIEGAEIAGLGELSDMTHEADKVITFGAHA